MKFLHNRINLLLIVCLVLVCNCPLLSQAKNDQLRIKGKASIGTFHFYDNTGSTLPSFGASLNVNTRISYRKFSVPIGVLVNNQGTSFQNPFNRYGISPTYKWMKVHLGWRRMRFSKFTLNGLQFFGAGIELTPKKFHFSAMKGKVDYRIPGIPSEFTDELPERQIMAAKIGVGSQNNHFNLILVKALDDYNELDTISRPKENVSIGSELKWSMLKNKVVFNVDGGISIFSENRKLDNELLENVALPRIASTLITPNISTHINYAVESELAINLGAFSVKNTYRRVMPEYQSLGLNYLRNDIESILFSPAVRMFKNKVSITSSVGIEKNNLDQLRNLDQSRIISSVNLNIRPTMEQNLNLQYSNFSFDQVVQFDSLITNSVGIKQVNKSYGGTYSINKTGANRTKLFSLAINYQDANHISLTTFENRTLSVMTNYNLIQLKINSSFNIGFNYFDVSFPEVSTKQAGVSFGYSLKTDRNLFTFNGGVLYGISDAKLNNHLSLKMSQKLSHNINLEFSTRLRYNQRSSDMNQFIIRSDLKFVARL